MYTALSYVAVFAAVVLVVRRRQQVERIVTAALLGSVPVLLYALVQWAGADPIAWGFDVRARVHGTIGGPIFLGGYLVMVLPLTLAACSVRWRRDGR